jgi:hypothetical protein
MATPGRGEVIMENTMNQNNIAEEFTESIESLKSLITNLGSDNTIKPKLDDLLNFLKEKLNIPTGSADADEASTSAEETRVEEDNDDGDDEVISHPHSFQYSSFSDEEIAGLIVGVGVGAALVGGGALLYKLLLK